MGSSSQGFKRFVRYFENIGRHQGKPEYMRIGIDDSTICTNLSCWKRVLVKLHANTLRSPGTACHNCRILPGTSQARSLWCLRARRPCDTCRNNEMAVSDGFNAKQAPPQERLESGLKNSRLRTRQNSHPHYTGQLVCFSCDSVHDHSCDNLIFHSVECISLFLMHSCLNMSNAKPLGSGNVYHSRPPENAKQNATSKPPV